MHVADAARARTEHDPDEAALLEEHLIHDHGRLPHEITGLPLRAVHDLEHFDESLGLLDLHHCHVA
jgi:hypothetical protein